MQLNIGFKYLIYNINSESVPVLFSGMMSFEKAIENVKTYRTFGNDSDTLLTLRSAGFVHSNLDQKLHQVDDGLIADTYKKLPDIVATGYAPKLGLVSRDQDSEIISEMLSHRCDFYLINNECMVLSQSYSMEDIHSVNWGIVNKNTVEKRYHFLTAEVSDRRIKELVNSHELAFNTRGM